MRANWLLLSLIFLLALPRPTAARPLERVLPQVTVAPVSTTSTQISISAPLGGQVLQGKVPIMGYTAAGSLQSSELSFAYTNDPTDTWFLIQYSTLPVSNGLLAEWDTTTITDGNYTLRLVATFREGNQQTVTIPGLRVRNYTPIETDTPLPSMPTATPVPGQPTPEPPTPTPTPVPTRAVLAPTALPANPAEISTLTLAQTVGIGALVGLGLLLLLGLYLAFSRWSRNRS
ncbi:MAG TPA: hypothetical protein PKM21_10625 [Anaerolineales bacterium]|nr:hypothetical protein [Anaerolineales bacterium]